MKRCSPHRFSPSSHTHSTASWSAPPKSCLRLAWLWLLLWTVWSPATVQATCVLKDSAGKAVPLSRMPRGVSYNVTSDELRCKIKSACENWTIRNCRKVHCEADVACKFAQFTNNEAVYCTGSMACQRTHFYKSHDVYCGGGVGDHSCIDSTIETDTLVSCDGTDSCTPPPGPGWQRSSMTVFAGGKGEVRCTRSFNDQACSKLFVHVNSRARSCFLRAADIRAMRGRSNNEAPCSVLCVYDGSCDMEGITFVLE